MQNLGPPMRGLTTFFFLFLSFNGSAQDTPRPCIYPPAQKSAPKLFPFLRNGKVGFINQGGVIEISPTFEEADWFSEGLAAARKRGRWGYIDQQGKWMIPPQFAYAEQFAENLAAVEVGSKWGYVDKHGRLAIPLRFDWATPFSEGRALIKVGA